MSIVSTKPSASFVYLVDFAVNMQNVAEVLLFGVLMLTVSILPADTARMMAAIAADTEPELQLTIAGLKTAVQVQYNWTLEQTSDKFAVEVPVGPNDGLAQVM